MTKTIPVIGLDRDGVINVNKEDYVKHPREFEPIPGSLEAIKMIRDKGYDVVILTNQAGIMKELMSPEDVDIVHAYMLELLGSIGCRSINGLYYATTNLKDDIYAKPNIGMFRRAEKEIGVNFANGVFVGDKISDLKAAQKAKARPVLVKTGHGEETLEKLKTFANKDLKKETEVFSNLLEFAESLTTLTG
jgi:D-glycero-D-manno-heptose 1,7-bisphosphate phosphatase